MPRPGEWPNPVNSGKSHPPRNVNTRLIGNLKSKGSGTSVLEIEVSGVNVLMNHFAAIQAIYVEAIPAILDVCADIGVERAKELVQVRTHATQNSINKEPGVMSHGERGEWSVRFGPTTFYAPFLEYGTVRNRPYPFMIPAGDMAEVALYSAILGLLALLDTNTGGAGFGVGLGSNGALGSRVLGDNRVRGPFSKYRSFLYSTAKALGDISVFGGRGFLGPLRSVMYGLARGLGDVGSIMSSTIGTRVTNRLKGHVTGRIIGYGSASLSYGKTYSAFVGGAGSHRVYQRLAGQFGAGSGLSSNGLLNRILPP